MNIATHILLAADFSVASDTAVNMAGELTRSLNAKLTVLNIHKPPPEPPEAAETKKQDTALKGAEKDDKKSENVVDDNKAQEL